MQQFYYSLLLLATASVLVDNDCLKAISVVKTKSLMCQYFDAILCHMCCSKLDVFIFVRQYKFIGSTKF